MKKGVILAVLLLILIASFLSFEVDSFSILGFASRDSQENSNEVPTFGPSESEISCVSSCISGKCGTTTNQSCNNENSAYCLTECNAQKPEQTEEEKCVEECAMGGCSQYDFACQRANQEKCDKQCGMIKEPEAKSEEEECIRKCVAEVDPNLNCGASQEGETGGEVCQKCAKQCEHLYAGPCLGEEKLQERYKECETCPHCYGEPIMGDSGEGWECIINVECRDATAEWGDEPGEGAGIGEIVWDTLVDDTIIRIKNFFASDESEEPTSDASPESEEIPSEITSS